MRIPDLGPRSPALQLEKIKAITRRYLNHNNFTKYWYSYEVVIENYLKIIIKKRGKKRDYSRMKRRITSGSSYQSRRFGPWVEQADFQIQYLSASFFSICDSFESFLLLKILYYVDIIYLQVPQHSNYSLIA